jgi:hypothetical protein
LRSQISHQTFIEGTYRLFDDTWNYNGKTLTRRKAKENLAFKTIHHVKNHENDDDDDEEIEKDISLIIRQLWDILKKK